MKQINIKPFSKNIFVVGASLIIVFLMSSCATRKSSFLTSTVVPAAEGNVRVKKDGNNNYAIKIDVKNLAEPDKLQPAKKAYVVWIETAADGIKNIGQIKTSTAFLSSKLRASFSTVSSFNPVKVFLTAEDDASIQFPSGETVLSTNNF
ncbi:MAG: hypothetical protein ABIP79_08070 [Chitinophagaceae bacterium]